MYPILIEGVGGELDLLTLPPPHRLPILLSKASECSETENLAEQIVFPLVYPLKQWDGVPYVFFSCSVINHRFCY